MGFDADDLSSDRFLGGRLTLRQPRRGYRAGIDAVLLAASIEARAGEHVLELGCGAGAAALCLGRRVAGVALTGVERQPDYADLARSNARDNAIEMQVVTTDLTALPDHLRNAAFDHVMMNPPYHLPTRATRSDDPGRAGALFEETALSAWVDTATRRLKAKGSLTVIQKIERLPEVLAAFDRRLGSVVVRPLVPRAGRDATLVLVRARKGGRAAFRLTSPLVLHEGATHPGDRDHYRAEVAGILREGAALSVG